MQVSELGLCGLKLVAPTLHGDDRGWFAEVFNKSAFQAAGLPSEFLQDNQSCSCKGVLRGLHLQTRQPQGKLIRVVAGRIWDVAVDLRKDSPTLGKWAAVELAPRNQAGALEMLWIPEGFAHGFLVLSEQAEVLYKVTRPYDPGGEQTVLWNDPELNIPWPLDRLHGITPVISAKDQAGIPFRDAALL